MHKNKKVISDKTKTLRPIKKLAGQTLVYGMGTMVPRLLNYIILTPYFTRLFNGNIAEYGKVTELYAYIAFMMIVLTYGMETAFFRYVNFENNKRKVFSTVFASLLTTSIIFIIGILLFSESISLVLKYEGEEVFIKLLGAILAVEAITAIPFAKLRVEEKIYKFAVIRIVQVVVNIGFMLFVYNILPSIIHTNSYLLNASGNISAKYIFISNLISSSLVLLMLSREIRDFAFSFIDFALLKKILVYALPLLVAGMAGVINETLDRTIFRHVIENQDVALYQLGIYGANYKLGSIIMIFVQMYRFAAEPFFFNYEKEHDSKAKYSKIMDVFVGVILAMSLTVILFIDYFKFFIDKNYYEGLIIVPWIVVAYIFYGIYFNQSIWYKLTNKTHYAFIITSIGAAITIVINIAFVPMYGYFAAAIGHLVAYSTMMVISYFMGEKHYPIKYNLGRIGVYFLIAGTIYLIDRYVNFENHFWNIVFNSCMLFIFIIFVAIREKIIKISLSKHES